MTNRLKKLNEIKSYYLEPGEFMRARLGKTGVHEYSLVIHFAHFKWLITELQQSWELEKILREALTAPADCEFTEECGLLCVAHSELYEKALEGLKEK